MKIIGIYGGSGTGKTTATKMLHKKIDNSLIISLDPYMKKYWEKYKKEILNTLNVKENVDKMWHKYIVSSIDNVKKTMNIIESDMEKDIKISIMEHQECDVIIIDWAFLPLIPSFSNCDFCISINSDLEIRVKRLCARLEANSRLQNWTKDALLDRLNKSDLQKLGYTSKYSIQNNGTLEELSHNLNEILQNEHINYSVLSLAKLKK